MPSMAEIRIAELEAEVARLDRVARSAVADHRALTDEQHELLRKALKPSVDAERALWWLLARVQKDPKPLRHDADCWLRHIHCFAEKLRHEGGPWPVARDLAARGDE